ncbi:MAG: squalene/phytoene synthase family protein [Pseudomonadota bacterium]|nr:squalene/phytoene synthase family protein [Pseudomonadota bacterium]
MSTDTVTRELLHDILKQVSRSFYLTLNVLPADVRSQMGLSYLFARAADTIADTDLIGREQRLKYLNQFRAQFRTTEIDWKAVQEIQTTLIPHQKDSAESILLQRLEDCLKLYKTYSADDRKRIQWLMEVLPEGMEMDLIRFPGESREQLTALSTLDELDRYTYYVAGCVGEFWTRMICAHRSAMAQWNVAEMSAIGVRFGKGLQLTNIVKDIARDLHNGRCYVPESLLEEAGLKPTDLLNPDNLAQFRPILARLVRLAVEHLDQGWRYTMAIPRSEIRQRLACMWPILLAGETLKRVATAPDLLDPAVNIKAPRSVVYRVIALTVFTGASGYVGTAYWNRIRKRISAVGRSD